MTWIEYVRFIKYYLSNTRRDRPRLLKNNLDPLALGGFITNIFESYKGMKIDMPWVREGVILIPAPAEIDDRSVAEVASAKLSPELHDEMNVRAQLTFRA